MDNESIVAYIKKNNLIGHKDTVIIGLSGGPDSVFLLHFLHSVQERFSLTLIAAHLDHQWRSSSHLDVIFCANICKKLGIPFISKKATELAITVKKNGSQEAIGRTLRRHFLESICKEYQANSIALGHHKQDQQETFFIRLMRGATLSGLGGIQPKSRLYIRPLLTFCKHKILDFLHNQSIEYLVDSTNDSDLYLRNRIRMTLLPTLTTIDKRFDTNLMRTITSLQETEQFLAELTQQTFDTLATKDNGTYSLSIDKFLALHHVLQYRILMHWMILQRVPFTPTQALLNEIIRFSQQRKSKEHTIYSSWSLCKNNGKMFIKSHENQ